MFNKSQIKLLKDKQKLRWELLEVLWRLGDYDCVAEIEEKIQETEHEILSLLKERG